MSEVAPHEWQPRAPIEIVAGTPPGGGQDRAARALSAALASVVDVPISVSNIAGRGGGNAWDELANHRGDACRLSISSPTLLTNPLTGVADLRHEDVTQLALLCTEFIVFAVPAASPTMTPLDLVERITARTSLMISLATARGNVNHIAVAYLARHAGTDPGGISVRVFDSARHAIADALEDAAGVVAVSAASVVPELRSGSLRALAVSAPTRLGGPLAEVPTWNELGVECVIGTWRGVIGEPELEPAALAFWEQSLRAAVETEDWREALSRNLWADTYLARAPTVDFMTNEESRMSEALSGLGLLGQ